jgi:hypothetical protein
MTDQPDFANTQAGSWVVQEIFSGRSAGTLVSDDGTIV